MNLWSRYAVQRHGKIIFMRTWLFLLLALCASAAQPGHDPIKADPALRRYGGQVTAIGPADPHGRIYSMQVKRLPSDSGYSPAELRGWRLTMLAGERFSHAFEVQDNTATHITVSSTDGPLNGVGVNDVFVIENTPLVRQ